MPFVGFFGPIICGTIGGCGGAFLAGNRLDTIKDGLNWVVESAFFGAIFFHITTTSSIYHHQYFHLSEPLLSARHARAIISFVFISARIISPHRFHSIFVYPIERIFSTLFQIPLAGDKINNRTSNDEKKKQA